MVLVHLGSPNLTMKKVMAEKYRIGSHAFAIIVITTIIMINHHPHHRYHYRHHHLHLRHVHLVPSFPVILLLSPFPAFAPTTIVSFILEGLFQDVFYCQFLRWVD